MTNLNSSCFWCISFMLISCFCLNAQTRNDLEQQRSVLLKQIDQTSATLKKTKANKEQTIAQYSLLEKQIDNRNELINNIQNSLEMVEESLVSKQNQLDSLQSNYAGLKETYANLLQIQLRKKYLDNPWLIILSAQNVSEAISKWRLFNQFQEYFDEKTIQLDLFNTEIQSYIDTLSKEKDNKLELLDIENQNAEQLEEEKSAKNRLLLSLSKNEVKLQQSLNKKRKEREALNKEIEAIIQREIVNNKSDRTNTNEFENTALKDMKSKLPWPANGKIVSWFGKHDHPTIKNIQIENNGIDISTTANASVKCVYEGTVITITFVPGHQNMVMIQHGKYFTVYSKLGSVDVSLGQKISAGQQIGKVASNSSNENLLHFEIWNGKIKENPSKWLKL